MQSDQVISCTLSMEVGLDKSGYQVNSFLISRQNHMLWALEVPCRGASNEYPQMFLSRNKTRIPRKASSHLLGQKSQEPQSERGY